MNPKQKIGDLLEERAKLVGEQREMLESAETEKRELTAEDRQSYDQRSERITEIEGDVRRYEALQSSEEFSGGRATPSLEGAEEDGETAERDRLDSDEYRSALDAYARGRDLSDEERSTLNTGTDAEGGFAVPESWTTLYEKLREAGTIRGLAEVITTSGGGALHIPREDVDAEEPTELEEEEEFSDDADELAEVILNAHKIGRTTKAPEEMVEDSLFDVGGYVGRRLGFQLGRRANRRYVGGTGVGMPEGLFAGATSAFDLASKTAISGDEVIDLAYSVIAPYRKGGVYIANDTTIGAIRKIKDSNGQYLWQASLQAGTPDTLNGFPVHADPDVEVLGSEKRVIGFGNVRLAYTIRDVLGVTIKFLDQRYAEKDQVAWRGKLRTDGKVIDKGAFKVATTPA